MEAVSLMMLIFDSLLGVGLLMLAWWTLSCTGLYEAIVLFVAFGLLLALAWVRVNATDVALAEAAIGAGLTGALLLSTISRLAANSENKAVTLKDKAATIDPMSRLIPGTLIILVVAGLGFVIGWLPDSAAGLHKAVAANLSASGVENPVTAVLLNFRAYDTLLELMVMFTALLGVWSLKGVAFQPISGPPGLVLNTLIQVLPPIMFLVAAYFLWVGSHEPGGAFQAGSILGAMGALLLVANLKPPKAWLGWPLRAAIVAGAALFIAIALVTLLFEGQLLQYPKPLAGTLIFILEVVASLAIGITLAALFFGGQPLRQGRKNE